LSDSVRHKLSNLNLHVQKGFGQHFLTDRSVLRSIIEAADLTTEDSVIEVGPGLGILTQELARVAGGVCAVEIDRGLASSLQKQLTEQSGIQIVVGDILRIPVEQLIERLGGVPDYKVVANLPYNITTAVIHHFLGAKQKPKSMVVMVQREVAESMLSKPGDMSLLAVTVQYYAVPSRIRRVPAGAFYPPPKVSSMIMKLQLREQPAVDVENAERFFKLVKSGFSARRKQLHNSIAQGLGIATPCALSAIDMAGIDPRRRAETLSLGEWASLYRQFEAYVED
jgi:16S rRNA (adenine1518-N6/adenine1519-N6)-dimethyltransferase